MKILFLTQVLPYPLDAGPKIRIYYVLRYLAQYHQVTLVSFIRRDEDRYIEHLRSFCHAVHAVPIRRSRIRDIYFLAKSLLSPEPFLIVRDHMDDMHAKIASLIAREKFDAVHADQLGMAQYAVDLPLVRVLDQHNAVWTIVHRMWENASLGPRKFMMGLEWRKLQTYEARICQYFDHVLLVTQEDKRALQTLDGNAKLELVVMPICIDTKEISRVQQIPETKHILCVGGMFYPPNVDGVVWFGSQVFPMLKERVPESKFLVVGNRPDPKVLELGKDDPRINVTGYVQDTLPYFKESAVFIVPLRAGGGMRVKILDAWARGIPIVSTTIGCEGIEVKPDENILIADTPQTFADAVERVILDRGLAERLAENGRKWVEEEYNWRVVYRKLDAIYARVAVDAPSVAAVAI